MQIGQHHQLETSQHDQVFLLTGDGEIDAENNELQPEEADVGVQLRQGVAAGGRLNSAHLRNLFEISPDGFAEGN